MSDPVHNPGATIAAIKSVIEEMHSTGPGEKNRMFNEALIADYRASGGKTAGELPAAAVVIVTMKGARTGLERVVPIGAEVIEGRLLIVASAAGLSKHPQWYHNLVAHPKVTAEYMGDSFEAEGIEIQGAERDRIFAQLNKSYHDLQAQTPRVFPVIELRRVS
ncbi:deazaflavin-dependent oxidoreductase, nitroreductase family [Novosphingobium sp. CF614]|nr:deazaflavin-dependent oxidoreductase, nitroreductase family [Novosphingobium sp. CF614]